MYQLYIKEMEITDKKVWFQIGRLETIGEQTGHTFEVTNEGEKYKYCVWMDGNKITALSSYLTADELERYIDGLIDMYRILKLVK